MQLLITVWNNNREFLVYMDAIALPSTVLRIMPGSITVYRSYFTERSNQSEESENTMPPWNAQLFHVPCISSGSLKRFER